MIRIENLTYAYPGAQRPVLEGLSLEIQFGEFVLVAGESGAGKSTFLRCLNGLVPHFYGGRFGGRVWVGDLDTVAVQPHDLSSQVGSVFQDPETQFVTERVEDELAFGMENLNLPRDAMASRIDRALAVLGVESMRHRPTHTLSSGERQLVAIGAALVLRPRLLVLDEPTSQLDPQGAQRVLEALERLNREWGLTVVLAEQRLDRVLGFPDQMLYLRAGAAPPLWDEPRQVMRQVSLTPPVIRLARTLGWEPLPLTVREARGFLNGERTPGLSLPGRGSELESEDDALAAEPGGGEAVVEIENLWFGYDDRPALRAVDLAVRRGEFLAIMGPNGSGKTTLAKHLVGLLHPDRGRVRVLGGDVGDREVQDVSRQVGYVPQNPNTLLFAETVREELQFTLKNHRLDGGEAPVDPDDLLGALGLGSHADTYPRDLSGGQRQRVALASILVTKPPLIVLDEPTRGLDYEDKEALSALLQEWRQGGATVLLVTHDVELAAGRVDRVVFLREGEVIADGPAVQVLTDGSFAPQMAQLFPDRRWLTVERVLAERRRC